MGVNSGPVAAAGAGTGGADVLEHLSAALRGGEGPGGWRRAVLEDLNQLRDALIAERPERSDPDGQASLRERSQLLSVVGSQRLQVMSSSDVDRLVFDLRRLVAEVRAHLRPGSGA